MPAQSAAPAGNRDKLTAAFADLSAATTRSGQLRYVTLLRELIPAQPTEVVLPLRETLGE